VTQYTVLWDEELEATWIASDSLTRAILTDVANWVDSTLSVDPDLKGQEQEAPVRILAVPISAARVSVTYQVLPEDRQVRVIRLVFRK
jgi:hypothetical protein